MVPGSAFSTSHHSNRQLCTQESFPSSVAKVEVALWHKTWPLFPLPLRLWAVTSTGVKSPKKYRLSSSVIGYFSGTAQLILVRQEGPGDKALEIHLEQCFILSI